MFQSAKSISVMIAIGALAVGLSGCQKKDTASSEKGPAEQAGQKLDQAASRAGEEINKAAEKAGKGMQQLGQKIQNEAEQAQQQQKKE